MSKITTTHYVDNGKLLAELIAYRKEVNAADINNIPPIPEYVGDCLLQIARRFSNKPNFAGYSYKEDMISDAVENCLTYLHNFDPAKSSNPFAYFTQIIYYAFLRRIEREKKQVYIKYKYAIHKTQLGEDHVSADEGDLKQPSWLKYENVQLFLREYEKRSQDRASLSRKPEPSVDDEDYEDFFDAITEDFDIQNVPEPTDDIEDSIEDDETVVTDDVEKDDSWDELPESLLLNGETK